MQQEELFAMVFVVGMFAGVFIIFLGLRQRSQQLEMLHRERMAMIERGQIPLSDPETRRSFSPSGAQAARSLSIGIIVVGLGLALMTIISVAGESPESGIGTGGAIAILGGAFIVRSLLVRSEADSTASASRSYAPPPPSHTPPPPYSPLSPPPPPPPNDRI
jgi:hypothetical protein